MAYKKPEYHFPKGDQGLNDKKSNGQIKRSAAVNCLYRIRTLWGDSLIDKELVDGIEKEVANGKYDNAIRLLNIIKEPEEQKIINEIKSEDGLKINIQPVKANE